MAFKENGCQQISLDDMPKIYRNVAIFITSQNASNLCFDTVII